jgi:hypothetical protein
MLKLAAVANTPEGVDRRIEGAGRGVAIVSCSLRPGGALTGRAFHWRLKKAIVPLLDISFEADGGLQRLKCTMMNDEVQIREELRRPFDIRRGRPVFETALWKPLNDKNFGERFVDENGTAGAKWISQSDLWICLNTVATPSIECEIHDSLSLLFDDRSGFAGVVFREISTEERRTIGLPA